MRFRVTVALLLCLAQPAHAQCIAGANLARWFIDLAMLETPDPPAEPSGKSPEEPDPDDDDDDDEENPGGGRSAPLIQPRAAPPQTYRPAPEPEARDDGSIFRDLF